MGRPKDWFDQRAEDGGYWTITVKREISSLPESWMDVVTLRYIPARVLDAHPYDVRQYGKMTRGEAIAMAKLLNASEIN
jgi:hypothetical protein